MVKRPVASGIPKGEEDKLFERARKIGMIMDPRTPTTPEDVARVTDEMLTLHLIEPVTVLDGSGAKETYTPTKEFVEAFQAVRETLIETEGRDKTPDHILRAAMMSTLGRILSIVEPTMDEAAMFARSTDYFFMMAFYMVKSGTHRILEIKPEDFFTGKMKKKAMTMNWDKL